MNTEYKSECNNITTKTFDEFFIGDLFSPEGKLIIKVVLRQILLVHDHFHVTLDIDNKCLKYRVPTNNTRLIDAFKQPDYFEQDDWFESWEQVTEKLLEEVRITSNVENFVFNEFE